MVDGPLGQIGLDQLVAHIKGVLRQSKSRTLDWLVEEYTKVCSYYDHFREHLAERSQERNLLEKWFNRLSNKVSDAYVAHAS